MRNNKIRWITTTAMLIALLVTLQWVTSSTQAFAGQYITGSCVNAVLAVAVLFGGMWSGVVVAALSPFCAYLFGIGPKLLPIVPGIALGNLIYIALLCLLIGQRNRPIWRQVSALLAAAAAKFAMLYVVINKCIVPLMGDRVNAKQVATFLTMFSWPQMVTALIGGAVALVILPLLKKALKK